MALAFSTANSVFIKNLSPLVAKEHIEESFKDCDRIVDIKFKCFNDTSTQRYCQIDFNTSAGVTKAIGLNGNALMGVKMVISVIDPSVPGVYTSHTSGASPTSATVLNNILKVAGSTPDVPASYLKQHNLDPQSISYVIQQQQQQQLAQQRMLLQAQMRQNLISGVDSSSPNSLLYSSSPAISFLTQLQQKQLSGMSGQLSESSLTFETEEQQLMRTSHIANLPSSWTIADVQNWLSSIGFGNTMTDSTVFEDSNMNKMGLVEFSDSNTADAFRELPISRRTVFALGNTDVAQNVLKEFILDVSLAKTTVKPRIPGNISFTVLPQPAVPVAYQQMGKLRLEEKLAKVRMVREKVTKKLLHGVEEDLSPAYSNASAGLCETETNAPSAAVPTIMENDSHPDTPASSNTVKDTQKTEDHKRESSSPDDTSNHDAISRHRPDKSSRYKASRPSSVSRKRSTERRKSPPPKYNSSYRHRPRKYRSPSRERSPPRNRISRKRKSFSRSRSNSNERPSARDILPHRERALSKDKSLSKDDYSVSNRSVSRLRSPCPDRSSSRFKSPPRDRFSPRNRSRLRNPVRQRSPSYRPSIRRRSPPRYTPALRYRSGPRYNRPSRYRSPIRSRLPPRLRSAPLHRSPPRFRSRSPVMRSPLMSPKRGHRHDDTSPPARLSSRKNRNHDVELRPSLRHDDSSLDWGSRKQVAKDRDDSPARDELVDSLRPPCRDSDAVSGRIKSMSRSCSRESESKCLQSRCTENINESSEIENRYSSLQNDVIDNMDISKKKNIINARIAHKKYLRSRSRSLAKHARNRNHRSRSNSAQHINQGKEHLTAPVIKGIITGSKENSSFDDDEHSNQNTSARRTGTSRIKDQAQNATDRHVHEVADNAVSHGDKYDRSESSIIKRARLKLKELKIDQRRREEMADTSQLNTKLIVADEVSHTNSDESRESQVEQSYGNYNVSCKRKSDEENRHNAPKDSINNELMPPRKKPQNNIRRTYMDDVEDQSDEQNSEDDVYWSPRRSSKLL